MKRFGFSSAIMLAGLILLFGLITTSYAALVNPSFETGESTQNGWPSAYGDWSGDGSQITTTENGITPVDGTRMLKFEYADLYTTGASGASGSQVVQLVDMSSYSEAIAAGQVHVSASAQFNRVAGDTQTDTAFAVKIIACEGDPADFSSVMHNHSWLFCYISDLSSDDDPNTWETLTAITTIDAPLPTNTDYIAVEIMAIENIVNDTSGTEFDGHYADNVSLDINVVPIPSAVWLLGSGLLGLLTVRRRHQGKMS